jgi:hypothetical protein
VCPRARFEGHPQEAERVEGDNSSEQSRWQRLSFEAFDRFLDAVVAGCDQLTSATWDQDIVRAELAARAAVASWLHAHAQLACLEPGRVHGPRWRIAAFALAANHRAITETLGQTRRMFSDPRLQQVLDHLVQTVRCAAIESPHPTSADPAG